jgi:ParB family transcriptional regulator, chromosome partitioning protein
MTYEKGHLYDMPLNNILPDPNQPRRVMDAQALDELSTSISKVGVLEPILFRMDGDGTPIVVAGERRVAAARKAGLATIPAMYVDGNPSEIALVENLLRQDLTSVEESEALTRLMTEQKYTQDQLAGCIGKARQTIGDILTINRLPQEIRDDCRGDRTISRATLIDIARKKQERSMITAYNAYKAKLNKGKTTRQKKDPNEPKAIFVMMDKFLSKLRILNTSAWTQTDMDNYIVSLNNVKSFVDTLLAQLATEQPKDLSSGKKTAKKLS